MLLNEFLEFTLGVVFETKYNALAVQEILSHKNKYPHIFDEISDIVVRDDHGELEEIEYDRSFFRCDDIEGVAGFDEIMELYRAFAKAFWTDIRTKKYSISSFSYGLDYLRMPRVDAVLYPELNYIGMCYIMVTVDQKDFVKEIFVPKLIDDQNLGFSEIKSTSHLFYTDNRALLKAIKDNFNRFGNIDDVFETRFTDDELFNFKREIDQDVVGYAFDSYQLTIGRNTLKFFATERGFDPLSTVLRLPIMDSLGMDEKELEVVRTIDQR